MGSKADVGCFVVFLGLLAVALGALGVVLALSASDCQGFGCAGREMGEMAAAIFVPVGLILLVVGSRAMRRTR